MSRQSKDNYHLIEELIKKRLEVTTSGFVFNGTLERIINLDDREAMILIDHESVLAGLQIVFINETSAITVRDLTDEEKIKFLS